MFATLHAVALLSGVALATPPDRIDAYLSPAAGEGERVVWDNHHRRVFRGDVCVEECDELSLTDARARVWRPHEVPVLVVVDVSAQRARVFERGSAVLDVRVAFGQAEGQKEQQGDNRTPRGRYIVAGKHKGAFGGKWAAYYGGHWIKVSYPNGVDARRGFARGVVNAAQVRAIEAADARGVLSPQNTRLGGGIGFHAWIDEWDDPAPGAPPLGLSWGCIVVHVRDVAAFYARVPEGAVVVVRG